MSPRLAVLLAVAGVLTTGCSLSQTDSSGPERRVSVFTCCTERDVNRIYHPGDVIAVHWIMRATHAAAPARPVPITLTAALDGGFANAVEAKSGYAAETGQLRANPVRVTDETTVAPVSRLRIPDDARPGLYNLTTTVESGGATVSGATIIRVE